MSALGTVATWFAMLGVPISLGWNVVGEYNRLRDRRLSEFGSDVKPSLNELFSILTTYKSHIKALETTSFDVLEEQIKQLKSNASEILPNYENHFHQLTGRYETWRKTFKLASLMPEEFEDVVLENVLELTTHLEGLGQNLSRLNNASVSQRVAEMVHPIELAIDALNNFRIDVENRRFYIKENY